MKKYRFWKCVDETIYQNVYVKLAPEDIYLERINDESEDEHEYFIDKELNKHYLGKIWEELPFETEEEGDLYYQKKGLVRLDIMDSNSDAFSKKKEPYEDPFHL